MAVRTAKPTANTKAEEASNRRGLWADEIAKAEKRYSPFRNKGNTVVDRYQLEKEDSDNDLYQDRFNILYSSTETTKPSLYATTPKVQATKRHRDRENEVVTMATMLMEAVGQFGLEEVDFDGVMKNVVQDYLLPGLGQAWVRYDPKFERTSEPDAEEVTERLSSENIELDYVHYKDFVTGVGRTWKELPWIARRVYYNQAKAKARFGEKKAAQLAYTYRPTDDGVNSKEYAGSGGAQAIIWEIWDKDNRKVIWYSQDYAPDVLDERKDPLRLKHFWPCPEPVRAVWTTRSFIPKSFYSQYKAQAEELDSITARIRHLTKALRLIGVYDGSQKELANLLNGEGNKLVAVENWAMFAQQGGVAGSMMFVPIKDVAAVLTELYRQRDIAKAEIYELTGFSDIQRGVSKASETLGAQQIKSDWAGSRLKDMQKEIQRFCRDVIAIMVEVMVEHFSEESLALYAGFEPPPVTDEEQAAAAQYAMALSQYQQAAMQPPAPVLPGQPPAPAPQQPQKPPPTQNVLAIQQFQKVVKLIKSEKDRAAAIGIETDSTLMPDEAAEREDRMNFLSSAGAFLQQAGPMALQFPDMRGLLGAIMMFTIRTFRASRPLEKEFDEFQKKLADAPPQGPPGSEGGGDNGEAAAQAQMQSEQMKQQTAQMQMQTDERTSQAELQAKQAADKYKIDAELQFKREQLQAEERYKMAELELRGREVAVKEAELGIKRQVAEVDAAVAQKDAVLEADAQDHSQAMDAQQAEKGEREFEASREDADRSLTVAEKAANAKKPT